MEAVLAIAAELERRDEAVGSVMQDVERLDREVEEMRGHAAATASFLAALPAALARAEAERRSAETALAGATEVLRAAEAEEERLDDRGSADERLAAARAVQQARDALREAELRLGRAQEERARLVQDGEMRRREAEELGGRARRLAARLAGLPAVAAEAAEPPGEGLPAVIAWASRARGGLLVAGAGLARERDALVREASELVATVSGDPLAATGVAGVRDRLVRTLGRPY